MTDEKHDKQANEWIRLLNLKPHQEGGYYSETYRSNDQCTLERYNKQTRSCSGSIYYLLKSPESPKSHFHRIKADEMWHFYKGSPLIIHVLDEEESSHVEFILNNGLDVHTDARPQILVPYGKWFAAEIITTNMKDNYTLCGCTCTPGFDFDDFECAKRSYLISKFPNLKELIIRLTPSE
jgi:predicted cupin superfamily sugar epimerase